MIKFMWTMYGVPVSVDSVNDLVCALVGEEVRDDYHDLYWYGFCTFLDNQERTLKRLADGTVEHWAAKPRSLDDDAEVERARRTGETIKRIAEYLVEHGYEFDTWIARR